jgi:hypothetical protein
MQETTIKTQVMAFSPSDSRQSGPPWRAARR